MKDYAKEIEQMEEHLREHPNDYQTQISLLVAKSNYLYYEHEHSMIPTKRRISRIKKEIKDGKECK